MPKESKLLFTLKGLVLETFDISSQAAHELASNMVASGDWGSDSEPASILDWRYAIKQELDEKLPWKSMAERERFRLDRALSKHLKPPTLKDFVQNNDLDGFRAAVKRIALTRHANVAEIETLKLVAEPTSQIFGAADLGRQSALKTQCLVALLAAGSGNDPFVLNRLEFLALEYVAHPNRYDVSPIGVLALVAMREEVAVPIIKTILQKPCLWSVRLACLYGLPESREDGNYSLIEEFRKWIEQATGPIESHYSFPDWQSWKLFTSGLTMEGLARLTGEDSLRLSAPSTARSPLIDWACDRDFDSWLMREATWLRHRSLWGEEGPIRDRLMERSSQGIVNFCMEQVRNPLHESTAHYDVNCLVRLHPRPLATEAADACLEIVRLQCHSDYYQQRIRALQLLPESADAGNYSRSKVVDLILDLARNEQDPDVRVAAIELVPWAAPKEVRQILAQALVHKDSRIHAAALKAVSKTSQAE